MTLRISTHPPNTRLKLTPPTRSFWNGKRNFPKFAPALQQWEAGQLSRESLGSPMIRGTLT